MNANPEDKEGYSSALKKLLAARPWLGTHTIGALTICVSHRMWTVRDGEGYFDSGRNNTADAMKAGVATAVNRYIRTCLQ